MKLKVHENEVDRIYPFLNNIKEEGHYLKHEVDHRYQQQIYNYHYDLYDRIIILNTI